MSECWAMWNEMENSTSTAHGTETCQICENDNNEKIREMSFKNKINFYLFYLLLKMAELNSKSTMWIQKDEVFSNRIIIH